MERTSGQQGKGIFLHRHFWRCVLLAGLFVFLLAPAFLASFTPVFATALSPSKKTFTVSPTRGPVGAVIAVSGDGAFFSDGTKIDLGYTVDYQTCTIVAGGQPGVIQNSAFRGWFRWPASTGTGTFGVCAVANSLTFQVGSYQVLSASPARVAVAPATPKAGQQATVTGVSFLPGGTSVSLIWRSTRGGNSIVLGTALSNGTGAFTRTFTVPARSSTGSYTLTATVGSGSPPTLSAVTTFHVNGITIVAVPTPVANASPTVASSATVQKSVTATPQTASHQPANTNDELANKTGFFVPLALSGTLLIVLALGAGVLVVRRQRHLLRSNDPTSGPLLWPEAASLMPGGPSSGPGAFTPWPGTMYPGGNSPAGSPGMEYIPLPGITAPQVALNKVATIPFDPGLAEAMREAQVSLFATPRPPVSEEIEVH